MLRELEDAGIESESCGVFSARGETRFDFGQATPILLRWLPEIESTRVRESIARSLTNEPEARRLGAAEVLVREFPRLGEDLGAKWAFGNALATLADASVSDDLIRLLRDQRHGYSRQMLCTAVRRTGDPRAPSVLIEMIDDDEVAGHAIAALRSFGPKASLPHLRHAQGKLRAAASRPTATPFTRKQARGALERLDTAVG
jgi:HEAT repeat protein